MLNSYPLTNLQTELSILGISTKLTEKEKEDQKFVEWENRQQEELDRRLVKSVLTNAGIDTDRNIYEQLHSY